MNVDVVQLAALAAVVEEGSFEAAARRLHVTPSAVSQRVKALEQHLGQVLVRRVRPCAPTEAGRVLFRLAGQWSLIEAEALREVGATAPDGGLVAGPHRLPIAVNADSLTTWFPPVLAAMPPGVVFDVHREDQDHTDALLRDGSVVAAVTADRRPVQGCRVHPLGAMRYLAVAAPSYLRRRLPDGATDEALAAAPLLAFNRKDALQDQFLHALTGRRLAPPTHHVPSSGAFVELVRQGLGWGMVPDGAAAADLAAGTLVELAPGRHLDVPLFWQRWRIAAPILDDLTARVTGAAREALHPL